MFSEVLLHIIYVFLIFVLGVFGGLDLHGKDVGLSWTQLATTVNSGSNQIVLSEQVSWSVGDDIVISPTSFNPWETESFRITAVAADNVTLTLNETLKYRHIGKNVHVLTVYHSIQSSYNPYRHGF